VVAFAGTGDECNRNLSPTQRYMHFSPAAMEEAIRLLDQRPPRYRYVTGEIAEPAPTLSVMHITE